MRILSCAVFVLAIGCSDASKMLDDGGGLGLDGSVGDAAVGSDGGNLGDAAVGGGDAGGLGDGGNTDQAPLPVPTCTAPIGLVDVAGGAVVGDGTPASCTETALRPVVAAGGKIGFACGPAPVTILLTQPLLPPLDKDTVIDGANLVTLDGGDTTRIIEMVRENYRTSNVTLTLERLKLTRGKATGTDYTPMSTSNPRCAYGYKDGAGGAVLVRDCKLAVIDCELNANHAATPGPDVGGGAIYVLGSRGLTVVGSRFLGNSASNGGAIGLLQSEATIVNSVFSDNRALGVGQNFAGGDADGCPGVGHPNQGGAGGNGGTIAIDGSDNEDVVLCGDVFTGNQANELGGVLFRTANTAARKTRIDRCTFDDNQAKGSGAMYLRNAKPLEIEATTFSNNTAEGSGVAQLDECTLAVVNTTFYGNRASVSLGGVISNFFGTTGVFRNVTFANNLADAGSGKFSAAIAGQMNFEFYNTLFWNNLTEDAGSPMTCGFTSATTGANNLQWPRKRKVGNADDTACVTGITFADAMLEGLADNGGPTKTVRVMSGSPALAAGADCPATDQRGMPRATACTIGAVE